MYFIGTTLIPRFSRYDFRIQESEMSVIAVYGDALDKLGFEMAWKANRNAGKRLTKTLNVYDDMANKNDAKYRKEK